MTAGGDPSRNPKRTIGTSGHEALLLKNQLCFPLYACSKEVVRRYRPLLAPLGLTYTQYLCMMVLWEEREATVAHIGRRLYLDSGTLTPVLRKLEAKGYVSRRRSRTDERVTNVGLTDAGRALEDAAAGVPARMAHCVDLPPEDLAQLKRLLKKALLSLASPESSKGTVGDTRCEKPV